MQINDNIKIQEHIKLESISISYGRTNSQYYQLCVCLCQCNKLRNKWLIFMRISKIAIPPNDMPPFHNLIPWWGGTLKMMWIQHDCPASFHETCQWLKFPLNGLRAQSRVTPVVELLPLASGLACLGWHFLHSWWNSYTAVTRSSFPRLWEQGIPREGEDDCWVG